MRLVFTERTGYQRGKHGRPASEGDDRGYARARVLRLCDGVSQSYDSHEFAKALSRSGAPSSLEQWSPWLQEVSGEYWKAVAPRRTAHDRERPGHSTYLYVRIERWGRLYDGRRAVLISVTSVGDTVFFHLRADGTPRNVLPILHSSRFGNTPPVLSTDLSENSRGTLARRRLEAWAVEGDRFVLCTDALAKWFLSELEDGVDPFEVCLLPRDEIDRTFCGLEASGRLESDDWSLIHCTLGGTQQ